MDIIMNTIIQYVAEIIGLLLVTAIGIGGTYLINKINKNKQLENISVATIQVISASQETVRRLQQTLVDNYKRQGALTPEQIEELKKLTQEITLDQLGQPVLDLLEAAKIDVSSMITNAAEAYINEMKRQDA